MKETTNQIERRQVLKASGGLTVAGLAGLSGCLGNVGGGGGAPDSIAYGISMPLSGAAASNGETVRTGMELAADELTEDGNIPGTDVSLELTFEDDECSSDGGAQSAQKLINQEGVDLFYASVCSPAQLAAMPVTRESNTWQMGLGVASEITEQGHPTILRDAFNATPHNHNLAKVAYDQGVESIGVVFVDNPYGQSSAKAFREKFEELGGTVKSNDGYGYGTSDFGSYYGKFESMDDLDGVYMVGYDGHCRAFIPSFRKRLSDVTLITPDACNDPSNVSAVGVDSYTSGGATIGSRIYNPEGTDMAKQLANAVTEKTDQQPNRFYAWGWDAIHSALLAFEIVGASDLLSDGFTKTGEDNDTDALVSAIKDSDGFETVWGDKTTYDSKGQMHYSPSYGVFEGDGYKHLEYMRV